MSCFYFVFALSLSLSLALKQRSVPLCFSRYHFQVNDLFAERTFAHNLTIVIYKALCFDVAQGRMKGVPNETRTHSCRFASLAC